MNDRNIVEPTVKTSRNSLPQVGTGSRRRLFRWGGEGRAKSDEQGNPLGRTEEKL